MPDHLINDYIAGAIGGDIMTGATCGVGDAHSSGTPDLTFGFCEGGAGLLVGHPFDTTKIQLQTQHANHRMGVMATAANIFKQGWTSGFYRGLSWPLMSFGAVNSVFFGVYGNTLKYLEKDKDNRKSSLINIYLAGCTGGMAQLVLVIPTDHVKVVLQSQIPHDGRRPTVQKEGKVQYFKGPIQCASYLYKTKGLRGLYKGGTVMLAREVPSYGLYVLVYEFLSGRLKSKGWTDSRGFLADFIAGGCAGCCCWLSIMPFDVVKSRYQADLRGQYSGLADCALKSYRTEGVAVFYRGTFITCLRAFPVNSVTFVVYSQVLQWLDKRQ